MLQLSKALLTKQLEYLFYFAIECPRNLNSTLYDHGLGYSSNVWEFGNRSIFKRIKKRMGLRDLEISSFTKVDITLAFAQKKLRSTDRVDEYLDRLPVLVVH
jgi:hypothetical protein